MFKFFSKKDDHEDDIYNTELNNDINKNQDWLYAIMTAISLGGIEKSITLDFGDFSNLSLIITGMFLVVILMTMSNFYLDIRARTILMLAKNKEEAYSDYQCKFKFIGILFIFSYWLLFITLFLTFLSYAYSHFQK